MVCKNIEGAQETTGKEAVRERDGPDITLANPTFLAANPSTVSTVQSHEHIFGSGEEKESKCKILVIFLGPCNSAGYFLCEYC